MAEKSWNTTGRLLGTVALAAWTLAALTIASPLAAQGGDGTVVAEVLCDDNGINCSAISGHIHLSDEIAAGFALRFEGATGLDSGSLTITAELVDPQDQGLTARLPAGTFIPGDFPVLLTIEPTAGSAFAFRRNWTLELTTENLEFSSHVPYRLFRSPGVGRFRDITFGLGSGSFRVLAGGSDFSELLMVADLRPLDGLIGQKFDRFAALVAASAGQIEGVVDEIEGLAEAARAAYDAGDLPAALAGVQALLAFVRDQSGTAIPDTTVPAEGQVGVSGLLLSSAATLAHSLFLSLESAQGGMSGFSHVLEVGERSVELALRFEEAFDVGPGDLAFTAELIDVHDPAFLARLPDGVHVPEEFPVLLRITPDAAREQAFSGLFEIELVTDDLAFVGDSPLRLFKAPDGGAFEDITHSLGLGSFRVLAGGSDFSEFVIAADLRPLDEVVGDKLARLEGSLEANAGAIPVAVRVQLQAFLAQVGESVQQGETAQAIVQIDRFLTTVRRNSGETIPALWRPGEPLANVAGALRSVAATLRFSLSLAGRPVADPADVNRDGQVDVGDVLFLIGRVFGGS